MWLGGRETCGDGLASVAGALLAGLLMPVRARADEAEDRAAEAIRKAGGKVERDERAPGRPVIGVNLGFTQVTDAGLKELKELKALRSLSLNGTRVTPAGVAELEMALHDTVIIH